MKKPLKETGVNKIVMARRVIEKELRRSILEQEYRVAELAAAEKQCADIRTHLSRCKDRIDCLSEAIALLDGNCSGKQ